MNITRILPYFAGCALLMASCANEDLTPDMHQGSGSVKFTLGGSAKKKSTRATVADEDKENHISNVLAVLFDKEAGFYKTVEANGVTNGQYEFNVERDGSYDIYFVANADAALKAKLEGITAGTKITDTENVLETIIATQDPGADNEFPMFCTAPASVEDLIIKDEKDLGTITMRRLAARFDIINNAPGITVTGITLKNSAKQSSLAVRNAEDADADASEWYADKRYDASTAGWPADFKCEMTDGTVVPVKFEQTIYSYENLSGTAGFSATNRPVIEVEYLEEDGQTKRTHDIELKEPKSGEILALQRNHLYRITLNYEYDLDFNLTVLDWDEAETFEYPDIPKSIAIPSSIQKKYNDRLMVNMFGPGQIGSVSGSNVSFISSVPTTESEARKMLFSDIAVIGKTLTDPASSIEYRVPTIDELMLLAPDYTTYTSRYAPYFLFNKSTPNIYWNADKMLTNEFSESLSNLGNDKINIVGKSILKHGSTPEVNIKIDSEGKFYLTSLYTDAISVPVYGIRFKDTQEYSAYKWENFYPKEGIYYTSIKIKAIPPSKPLSIEDIVDNDKYWETDYIEFIIYHLGALGNDAEGSFIYNRSYNAGANLVSSSNSSSLHPRQYSSLYIGVPYVVKSSVEMDNAEKVYTYSSSWMLVKSNWTKPTN
ncbi:MAG: hypothetical protein K2M93_09450 [Muribaculaceae bacterium]|nr:hypothetical protein [Muribaculaceae bacterium]